MIMNVVACANLDCVIDLKKLTLSQCYIIYNSVKLSSAMWGNRNIVGLCTVFANGQMMVNGKV